jgi:hypothetical protein
MLRPLALRRGKVLNPLGTPDGFINVARPV